MDFMYNEEMPDVPPTFPYTLPPDVSETMLPFHTFFPPPTTGDQTGDLVCLPEPLADLPGSSTDGQRLAKTLATVVSLNETLLGKFTVVEKCVAVLDAKVETLKDKLLEQERELVEQKQKRADLQRQVTELERELPRLGEWAAMRREDRRRPLGSRDRSKMSRFEDRGRDRRPDIGPGTPRRAQSVMS